VAFFAQAAGVLFMMGAAFLVICVLAQIAQGTGHPGIFWSCLMGAPVVIAVAYGEYAEWRTRRFVGFARSQFVMQQDPTGWKLYDRGNPSGLLCSGAVPYDKIWFCKQNQNSAEARRLMEPPPTAWTSAIHQIERDKCINALCAPVPRADRDIFVASAEFRTKLHAVEEPYIQLDRQCQKLEEAKSRKLRRTV